MKRTPTTSSRLRRLYVRVLMFAMALAALLGAGVSFTLAASARAASASGNARTRAVLTGAICRRALDPPDRTVSVTAVMRPVTGTQHMEIEFQLLARSSNAAAYAPVSGNGLGIWVSPENPTLGQRPGDVWKVNHPVANLPAPAMYRFSVSFRWLGTNDKVLGTVTRKGPLCMQKELRPDLYVKSFVAQRVAHRATVQRYAAVIGNEGGGPARNFEVQFSDAGATSTQTIHRLAQGATRTLTFRGPVCVASAPPKLVLDPTDAVDDLNPGNNTATVTCPAGSPSAAGSGTSTTPAGATGSAGATGRSGSSGGTGPRGTTGATGAATLLRSSR